MAQAQVKVSAPTNIPTPRRYRPADLFRACETGSLNYVRQALLTRDPNIMNDAGWTPLMYASHYGYYTIVEKLVEAGAKIDFPHPITGKTALMMAAGNGHTRCLEKLVSSDANLRQKDFKGNTAADYAHMHGHASNRLLAHILGINPIMYVKRKQKPDEHQIIDEVNDISPVMFKGKGKGPAKSPMNTLSPNPPNPGATTPRPSPRVSPRQFLTPRTSPPVNLTLPSPNRVYVMPDKITGRPILGRGDAYFTTIKEDNEVSED